MMCTKGNYNKICSMKIIKTKNLKYNRLMCGQQCAREGVKNKH